MAIPELITIGQALFSEDVVSSAASPSRSENREQSEEISGARVREYQRELARLAASAGNSLRAERLSALAQQFNAWANDVDAMAQRVRMLKADALVKQDLRAVPESLRAIQERLERESDPNVHRSLEQTAAALHAQIQALEKFEATSRHAEAQLEATLASLGAIYTQALANLGTNQTADYRHLAAEVDERMHTLQDELAAIEEVRGIHNA